MAGTGLAKGTWPAGPWSLATLAKSLGPRSSFVQQESGGQGFFPAPILGWGGAQGRALSQHVQDPGFHPQHPPKNLKYAPISTGSLTA